MSSNWRLWHTTGGGPVWAQKKIIYLTGQGDSERAAKTVSAVILEPKHLPNPVLALLQLSGGTPGTGCHFDPVYYSQSSSGP